MEITLSQKVEADTFMESLAEVVREVVRAELVPVEARLQASIQASTDRIEGKLSLIAGGKKSEGPE